VNGTPWVHIDIAGTAWGQTRPYVGKGASGFGTRMLIELARRAAGEG
jgi:leucyl aminopeptidase